MDEFALRQAEKYAESLALSQQSVQRTAAVQPSSKGRQVCMTTKLLKVALLAQVAAQHAQHASHFCTFEEDGRQNDGLGHSESAV